jgi:hypothetical protein
MSLWARVVPDDMGRPYALVLSSQLVSLIGTKPIGFNIEDDGLALVTNPDGEFKINSAQRIVAWRVLDVLNSKQILESRPFAVKREGQNFKFFVWQYDDDLPSRSQRLTATPMQYKPAHRNERQRFSQVQFIKAFALAEIILERNISQQDLDERTDALIAALPENSSISARFGHFSRLRSFIDYQVQTLKSRGTTENDAKMAFFALVGDDEANNGKD